MKFWLSAKIPELGEIRIWVKISILAKISDFEQNLDSWRKIVISIKVVNFDENLRCHQTFRILAKILDVHEQILIFMEISDFGEIL